MKTAFLPAALSLAFLGSLAFGQGSLTPPGAPAPVMKALDEVEPRTVVNGSNTPGDAGSTFVISAPGSYFLARPLAGEAGKAGITVVANDVTLDLNGFTVQAGAAPNGSGIQVDAAVTSFRVRGGTLRGWSAAGLSAGTALVVAENLLVHTAGTAGIQVGAGSSLRGCSTNGCTGNGFTAGSDSSLRDCSASSNGGSGFLLESGSNLSACTASENGGLGFSLGNGSNVRDCVATGNSGNGFFLPDRTQAAGCIATRNQIGFDGTSFVNLTDCTASRNRASGINLVSGCLVSRCAAVRNDLAGISVQAGSTVADCAATSNLANGIETGEGSAVRGSTAQANTIFGISAGTNSQITGNTCEFNGSTGIYTALAVGVRIDGNHCARNGAGGFGVGVGCFPIRNTARGNVGLQYSFTGVPGGGPIIDLSAGGTIPANTSPWANFIH